MEIKEFSTILSHLSSSSYKLPLLSSYFFSNSTCKKSYTNTANSNIEMSTVRQGGVNTLLINFLRDFEKVTSVREHNNYLCLAYTFKDQKALSHQDIKQILDGRKTLPSILCLQRLRPCTKDKMFYSISLHVRGIKYSYKFFVNQAGSQLKCSDPHLVSQGKNLSKLILSILLKSYQNPITMITVDFLADSHRNLWVKYIKVSRENSAKVKKVDTVILSSSDSMDEAEQKNLHGNKKLVPLLRRSNTLSNRKSIRFNTDSKVETLKKQLSTIINKSYESEQENSKESLDSDDSDIDADFFEILAREKFKINCHQAGIMGKVTPDNELLVKEMKIVKRTIETFRLPAVQGTSKGTIYKIRKTVPLLNLPHKYLPTLRRSLTKN